MKREYLLRYSHVIKKLKRKPCSFKEIEDSLARESELLSYDLVVSKRTFQRDLEDIRSLFNIDIRFDFSRQHYFIEDEREPELNERILEAFDTFNALQLTEKLSEYVHFENRKPQGTEHLTGLLHAIQSRKVVEFAYHKYADEVQDTKTVEPLALKEYKQRWYLIARDRHDENIKILALDRMQSLEISAKKFSYPKDFSVKAYFRHCFGIIRPKETQPEEIVLSFTAHQGNYIKSLPLHESQQILADNDTELRIGLKLSITDDFLMELMSFGDWMKVLQPKKLADEMKTWHKLAAGRYAKGN